MNVKDIADGETYVHVGLQELLRLYYVLVRPVDEFDVFVGIDGIPISESSCGHFIPIMCAIIPKDPDEESYVAAIEIWYADKTKPTDTNLFLKPFVEEAKTLLTEGASIDGKQIPVNLLGLTFETVAKSELLGLISHSGYWACPRCKIKGVSTGGIHFPGVEEHPPHSHAEFRGGYKPSLDENLDIEYREDYHHQRYTILEQLPNTDLVKQVVCDPMHILWIGIARTLLKLIVTGHRSFRMSETDVAKVNKRHSKMRQNLPREFARTFKSISKYFKFKATQGRQFILYCGIVTLFEILPEEQCENLLLLHAASFILFHPILRTKKRYVDKAQSFYEKFGSSFTEIYGENHTTHNIHMVLHLIEDVKRFKDPNRTSACQFENF